jgi:hypothetical protein
LENPLVHLFPANSVRLSIYLSIQKSISVSNSPISPRAPGEILLARDAPPSQQDLPELSDSVTQWSSGGRSQGPVTFLSTHKLCGFLGNIEAGNHAFTCFLYHQI